MERIIDVVKSEGMAAGKTHSAEAPHRTRFDGCHQKEVRGYIEALRGMGDFDHEHGYRGCRVDSKRKRSSQKLFGTGLTSFRTFSISVELLYRAYVDGDSSATWI